jgi:peptidoglycan/LPS O-acetylase OafA/YrhL
MTVHRPRYFLMLAIFILALGCFLILGGSYIKPNDWPMYLAMACILTSICVAALIEALQAQLKRIEELERKLGGK